MEPVWLNQTNDLEWFFFFLQVSFVMLLADKLTSRGEKWIQNCHLFNQQEQLVDKRIAWPSESLHCSKSNDCLTKSLLLPLLWSPSKCYEAPSLIPHNNSFLTDLWRALQGCWASAGTGTVHAPARVRLTACWIYPACQSHFLKHVRHNPVIRRGWGVKAGKWVIERKAW